MSAIRVAAIFDVGKTNKKLLLFDEHYRLVYEECAQLDETIDEEGFPCEDVHALTDWMISSFEKLSLNSNFKIAAVNFSGYGASFVHIDSTGEPCTPLYNYLKPYPEDLLNSFYNKYGGREAFSLVTASPALGSLNSGMQLYRLKCQQPEIFARIQYSLHLPQYLSYILTGKPTTDITSVGCHTNLWNFQANNYHEWLKEEGVLCKFAPLSDGSRIINDSLNKQLPATGIGLHDSSAALIPYLHTITEPFILISTGTWCISMNPFNKSELTIEELNNDCLCYLTYKGDQVKSARLFAGNEHEREVRRIAGHFNKDENYHTRIGYDPEIISALKVSAISSTPHLPGPGPKESNFKNRSLTGFSSFEYAYHQLIFDIMKMQVESTALVISGTGVNRIFVDGGFSKNDIYMQLLADSFPGMRIAAASIPQSTGLGAALAIHQHWNSLQLPSTLIQLKNYRSQKKV
jgi:sugar (pentulose or hexulose) kinase